MLPGKNGLRPLRRRTPFLMVAFALSVAIGSEMFALHRAIAIAFNETVNADLTVIGLEAPANRRHVKLDPGESVAKYELPLLDSVQGKSGQNSESPPVEYYSPVASMLNHFPNRAVEHEIHKHDRWIVDSLAYLNTFDQAQAAKYTESGDVVHGKSAKPITIVVMTINRTIPYLAVLVAMLLRGHGPNVFMERLDVHIVNIERRKGKRKYFLFEDLQSKLPFIAFHSWTAQYEQHSNITDSRTWYLANQRVDYIRALEVCKNAGSDWCVVMEDDAVPCVGFAHKFDEFVNKDTYLVGGRRSIPISRVGGPVPMRFADDEVSIDKVGIVKLYVPFNNGHEKQNAKRSERDIIIDKYAMEGYDLDRALDFFEANATGGAIQKIEYKTMFSNHGYGAVAEAYPSAILGQLISYVSKKDRKGNLGKVKEVDLLISSEFIQRSNKDRLEMSPSLVNHIGYISEHMGDAGPFERMSTDVRFQLDDGYRGGDKAQDPSASLAVAKSPVMTMLNHFPNHAVAHEVHKHDRWIVDSLAYLNTFDGAQAAKYTESGNVTHEKSAKPITIVVMTINRTIPYLAVLVAMLLRGHSPNVFMERLDVHIVNIERRKGKSRYLLFEDLQSKLPFIAFHNWTAQYEQHSHVDNARALYLANQRVDYIRALGMCKDAGSDWCVVMEDDAVPCVGFAHKFDKYVNNKLKYEAASSGVSEVSIDRVGLVKLYVPFNDGHMKNERDILLDVYAQDRYDGDRALDLLEAEAKNISVKKVDYHTSFSTTSYGAVAEAYPAAVLDRIIDHLKTYKVQTSNKTVQSSNKRPNLMSSSQYTKPVDVIINYNFFRKSKMERLEMSPSLVNHIGYISEHKGEAGLFDRVSTDVRFQLDDGP